MSTRITYKGTEIASFENDTKTLTTRGKYLEDNIEVADATSPALLQEKTATPTQYEQVILADEGYTGLSRVTVNPIPNYYGLITYNGSILTVS